MGRYAWPVGTEPARRSSGDFRRERTKRGPSRGITPKGLVGAEYRRIARAHSLRTYRRLLSGFRQVEIGRYSSDCGATSSLERATACARNLTCKPTRWRAQQPGVAHPAGRELRPRADPGTIHRVLARVRLRKAPSEASSTSATPMLKVAPHGPATSGASLASSGLSGVGRDPPSHAYARRISAGRDPKGPPSSCIVAKAAGVKRRASAPSRRRPRLRRRPDRSPIAR